MLAWAAATLAGPVLARGNPPPGDVSAPAPEVRGTWLTTTANDAIASPEKSEATMRRLREIGLNTVYVESWKNGYTQYPSEALRRVVGVDRRPNLMPQDPSDSPESTRRRPRDLLQETLIEAHRNGLVYIAWFEYGFMAAHKDTDNHLRRLHPDWMSRDAEGNEVAPNGFVWMNPIHPEPRRLLVDLVVEAIDRYDLDGVQLDDRIVWPYFTMGYDDYTIEAYARENDGRRPPADPKDPQWMRWRADKINEYARHFVREVRARRPGIVVSLSPCVYPWVWDHYLLEWPRWVAWQPGDAEGWWDEFIPQCYRLNYDAFANTWNEQVREVSKAAGPARIPEMYAGIRLVGDGPDLPWADLRDSILLARRSGSRGHVHWFSRGVLDIHAQDLTSFYDAAGVGPAPHPRFGPGWRVPSLPLTPTTSHGAEREWQLPPRADRAYRLIARESASTGWVYLDDIEVAPSSSSLRLPAKYSQAELLIDRRLDLSTQCRAPFPSSPPGAPSMGAPGSGPGSR